MGEQLELYAGTEPTDWPAPTLTEALARRGYSTRASGVPGIRYVIDRAGGIVTSGRAWEVWRWLKRQP